MSKGLVISESGKDQIATFHGPITDVHMHPRLFDARFPGEAEAPNGKAGVAIYSKTAVNNGICRGLAMTNESLRIYAPSEADQTKVIPYPVNSAERLLQAANMIIQNSVMEMGLNLLVDPSIIGLGTEAKTRRFTDRHIKREYASPYVRDYAAALKIFGDESTGGYAIPLDTIIPVAKVWHKFNPEKPVILHLEDENVGRVLEDWPADIAVHIAHTSSRQELEPIIIQKENGKDVSCEATPHHWTLTSATREAIGALGCMKPPLKTKEDVAFLRDHVEYIDMFGSDCAPHRLMDKVGPDGQDLEKPAFGVTNHDVFLPIFLQDVLDGRLTEKQLYDRVVVNPARRFKLPLYPASVAFVLQPITAQETIAKTPYGQSPFDKSPETPKMVGRLRDVKTAGRLAIYNYRQIALGQRYSNLITF